MEAMSREDPSPPGDSDRTGREEIIANPRDPGRRATVSQMGSWVGRWKNLTARRASLNPSRGFYRLTTVTPPSRSRSGRPSIPASRISAAAADAWAVRQVRRTGDPDLGLKAGRSMLLGRAGALDYAMHSAATLRKAADLARRYGRLFSDRLNVHCEIEADRATVHVDVGSNAPRPVCDFAMSAWFTNHVRGPLHDVSGVECWFSYPEPRTGPSTNVRSRRRRSGSTRHAVPSRSRGSASMRRS